MTEHTHHAPGVARTLDGTLLIDGHAVHFDGDAAAARRRARLARDNVTSATNRAANHQTNANRHAQYAVEARRLAARNDIDRARWEAIADYLDTERPATAVEFVGPGEYPQPIGNLGEVILESPADIEVPTLFVDRAGHVYRIDRLEQSLATVSGPPSTVSVTMTLVNPPRSALDDPLGYRIWATSGERS